MTCVYDAPNRLAQGQTEPALREHWCGPKGHTLLSWEADFRPGGGSRLRVRSPEGHDYWIDGAHLEIAEPERVVFTGELRLGGERLGGAGGTITFRRT